MAGSPRCLARRASQTICCSECLSSMQSGLTLSPADARLAPTCRSTAPRMLLKLATTLVSQALAAYQRKMVDLDTLKAGLSYFSQPFLAWQLTGIVPWLVREIQRVG